MFYENFYCFENNEILYWYIIYLLTYDGKFVLIFLGAT